MNKPFETKLYINLNYKNEDYVDARMSGSSVDFTAVKGFEDSRENVIEVKESGEFTSEEWNTLESFKNEVMNLNKSDAINIKSSLNINFDVTKGFTDNSILPSDGVLNDLLMRLRPFILKQEPFYFNKVLNILKRHLKHDESQSLLIFLKDLFSGKRFQALAIFTFDEDMILNSEGTLDDWLNAFHFHRDRRRKINLKAL